MSFSGVYFGAQEGIDEYLSGGGCAVVRWDVEFEPPGPTAPPKTVIVTAKTRRTMTTPTETQRRGVVGGATLVGYLGGLPNLLFFRPGTTVTRNPQRRAARSPTACGVRSSLPNVESVKQSLRRRPVPPHN